MSDRAFAIPETAHDASAFHAHDNESSLLRRRNSSHSQFQWGVYATFLFLGLSMLLPWNVWITATSFFEHRLAGTFLANTFESWFGVVSMLINLAGVFVSFTLPKKFTPPHQTTLSLLTLLLLFLLFSLFSLTSLSGPPFAAFTLLCVLLSSAATALLQSAVFATAATYQPVMAQGIMNGQGVAGAVPAIVQVLIALGAQAGKGQGARAGAGEGERPGAVVGDNALNPVSGLDPIFWYFLLAATLTLASMVLHATYLHPSSFTFARFVSSLRTLFTTEGGAYQALPTTPATSQPSLHSTSPTATTSRPPLRRAIRAVMAPLASAFLIFLVTLSVFPAITAYVRSTAGPGTWKSVFVPVGFLVFCLGDWLGRFLPLFPAFHPPLPSRLLLFSLLRVLLVPLFVLCNVHLLDTLGHPLPRAFPVVIPSDAVFMLAVAVLGVSNGWGGSVAVMAGAEGGAAEEEDEQEEEQTKADAELRGRVMVVGLTGGLLGGTVASFGVRAVVCGCNPF